jgi:hypothetical protein
MGPAPSGASAPFTAEEIIATGSRVGPATGFTFTFDAPALVSTNPTHDSDGGPDKLHIAPSSTFGWSGAHGIASYGLSTLLIADEYLKSEGADLSILGLQAKLALRENGSGISLKGSYTPKRVFANIFGSGTVTLHDLSIGASRAFPLGTAGTNLSLDISYIRREASKRGFQQHQPTLLTVLTGTFAEDIGWQVKGQVQRRVFSSDESDGRKDWNLTAAVELSYALIDNILIKGGVAFERNNSNRSIKDYSVFDFGPRISLAWNLGR